MGLELKLGVELLAVQLVAALCQADLLLHLALFQACCVLGSLGLDLDLSHLGLPCPVILRAVENLLGLGSLELGVGTFCDDLCLGLGSLSGLHPGL